MVKAALSAPIRMVLSVTSKLRESVRRLYSHAALAAQLRTRLSATVVVLGKTFVDGTRQIHFGENILLYPELHFETQGSASIIIGDGVVISCGVHIVGMAGITIGPGTMIGEYASIRDANHTRAEGVALRDAGHNSKPIVIGREVWIGRGAAILAGVAIGDHATIGANAVVTSDVAAGSVVGGVPAKPLSSRTARSLVLDK
jgi:acetyltransferase-like isoleucine patch superfamily enzyme